MGRAPSHLRKAGITTLSVILKVCMSWDVILLRLPAHITKIEEAPDDGGEPLGATDEVGHVLHSLLPTLDLTDPTWGILETPS